jgi:hypothetical protein
VSPLLYARRKELQAASRSAKATTMHVLNFFISINSQENHGL